MTNGDDDTSEVEQPMTGSVVKAITLGGVYELDFDIGQAQQDGYVEYSVTHINSDNIWFSRNVEMIIGNDIANEVAKDFIKSYTSKSYEASEDDVQGFIVPEYLLPQFIHRFPNRQIFNE